MRKKFLTLMIVAGALTLGACEEQDGIDKMLNEDIELNQNTDPDDDKDPPGGGS